MPSTGSTLRTHADFPLRPWQLVLYVAITIAGVFGNCLILLVLKRRDKMRSSAFGTYIGSLAIADLLVSTLCLPVYLTSTSWFRQHPQGTAGDVMCKFVTGYFVLFLFAFISVYTLVALSYERYQLICHPFKARQRATPKRAKCIVALIWAFAIVPNLPLIFGQRSASGTAASIGAHCTYYLSYENENYGKVIFAAVFTIQFLLPISCMVVCFLKIRPVLRGEKDGTLCREVAYVQPAELAAVKARRKTVRTVIIMIVAYFSCWALNQALYLCLNFGFGVPWNGNLMQVSVILCFLASCVNPFIYALRSQQFSDGFAEILCHCARRKTFPSRGSDNAPITAAIVARAKVSVVTTLGTNHIV
eukprot:gene7806-8652_t